MSQQHTKNMKSKNIIGLYLLTGSVAYKVTPVKSFLLG